MASSSLLLDIQLSYNQFTKTEKKIADYIVENVNLVLFMSITDLADACNVAEASVHRFCRTMGMKGYQEFKMKLSLSLTPNGTAEEDAGEKEEDTDSLSNMMEHILESHINVLRETKMLLYVEAVDKAVNMMEKARHIYFYGIGDSLLTAQGAHNKFLRITNKVSCIRDPHMQAMQASMSGKDDLIVIISYSGSTKDNIYVAEIAKQAGARIVGITHFPKSPLTNYTDVVLTCGANEGPLEGGSMAAKMSQLYIIDILYQEYYRRNLAVCRENNKKTSKAVVEKLY